MKTVTESTISTNDSLFYYMASRQQETYYYVMSFQKNIPFNNEREQSQ